VNIFERNKNTNIIEESYPFKHMACAETTTLDSKTCPFESDDASKEEELFNAVESNNVIVVKNFQKDELRRL